MPLHRGAQAELRRIHRDARWVLAGVVLDGEFHPASRVFEPASARLWQSGLVIRANLPDFIAPEGHAKAVAFSLARYLAADVRTVADHEVLIGGQTILIPLD